MAPAQKKRRRPVDDEESDEVGTSTRQSQVAASVSDESDSGKSAEETMTRIGRDGEVENEVQITKKFVRYALACEYQRMPIRRPAIIEKVFNKSRVNFKKAFEAAQEQLKIQFGMEMVELPGREKRTLKEKQKAARSKSSQKSTTSYVLRTILPEKYRIPDIVPPSLIEDINDEAAYLAICTVVVSIISLSVEGQCPDHKLMRYLKRMNADENMPIDKTSAVLLKMVKQGYIVKIVDRAGDEETTDWIVGPRGKVEVGVQGTRGLVNTVYGDQAPDDLSKRLDRSLGINSRATRENGNGHVETQASSSNSARRRKQGRRSMPIDEDEDD